ncbi:MAG: RsmB/NOP family class I SAM-dependent RNA methyltransferase [Desulfurococcaceae archaeon]
MDKVSPSKSKFFITLLLKTLISRNISFDQAFNKLTKKYGIRRSEARYLYKISYYTLIYYHGLKYVAKYHGYGQSPLGILEYLSRIGFNFDYYREIASDIAKNMAKPVRLSIIHGYPLWFVKDLYDKISVKELDSLLGSLNERKRWIRVNTSKASVKEAIECLEETGLLVERHQVFSDILYVKDPFLKIGNNKCILNGLALPQDISSYIAVKATGPYEGVILDACSAPGIKLAQIMTTYNPVKTIAVDYSAKRTSYIKHILNRVGIKGQVLIINGDSTLLEFNTKFNTILVDAPCSGSGAIYSDPAIKLRLTRDQLNKYRSLQIRLLDNLIKYGERIVYMTCSIHPSEGEEVIDEIYSKYRIELEELSFPMLSKGYKDYEISNNTYRIVADKVRGQGFFICAFRTGDHK